MAMSTNLLQLADELRTEADAYRWLEQRRWGNEPACPHCGSIDKHYFLKPADGASRETTRGTRSERRVWKCKACRKQFSVLTGTLLHGTKIAVRKWVLVMFEMSANRNGMSAREIQRKYGLTAESAWFMAHRLREAMNQEPIAGLLSGRVVADETWYGGKASNRHGHNGRTRMQGAHDKTPIMSLVSRETGEVRSRVLNDVKPGNLRAVLDAHVDRQATHLHTDSSLAYRSLGRDFASHTAVNHNTGEYVRGDVSTNQAEAYFAQLKRSLDGTHHHVSRVHLHRYVAEFDFRYSTCKQTDSERMRLIVERLGGKRLTYRKPTRR